LFGVIISVALNESPDVGCCQPAFCFQKKPTTIEVLSKTETIGHLAAPASGKPSFTNRGRKPGHWTLHLQFHHRCEPELLFCHRSPRLGCGRLILGLILICHCSYQCCGTIELFDLPISVEFTIGYKGCPESICINITQDLSAIQVGLHDEIFQEVSLY